MKQILNLGILAHVDAGKTTLTERLLYAAGVIDEIGSVDKGTTQTDSLALERQRGITIKSAVVSFTIDGVTVNLIDTPGHPDFIAEVERALAVLDGAVLVISAVEGVQSQTRVLARTLQRLGIPTLIFVNKIDRGGADDARVLQSIADTLTPSVVAMGAVHDLGTRAAHFTPSDASDLPVGLATDATRGRVHPVFFGSAITGAGIDPLARGIAQLLPSSEGDVDGPVSGTVFKIERGRAGEKIAYVRMFSGTVRVRDSLLLRGAKRKVTAVRVFDAGGAGQRGSVVAGEIGKLSGLGDVQVGDAIGAPRRSSVHHFAPPTLETVVVPRLPGDKAVLRVALAQLAEQDPLINVHQDDGRQEISVSLYGEVQKEVIAATLATDFGVEVTFRETTTIYIERLRRSGRAAETLQSETHPYSATVGLRIEPAPPGSGVQFRLDFDPRLMPIHIYKTRDRFIESMTQYVSGTLREGPSGWRVTDCVVTMDDCGYYVADGPAKPTLPTPKTTAKDFRKLTPIVLRRALTKAGTLVCEPIMRASIEVPTETVGGVLAAVSRLGDVVDTPSPRGNLSVIEALLPAARTQELRRQLPGMTGGEGVVEATFEGYRPLRRG